MVNTVTVSLPKHSADPSSASEHFGKIQSHGSRASLLGGGSFDPPYRHAPGGFRAREGYTNVASAPTRKIYIPNSQWTWSFATVTFVQTLVTLALEMYAFPLPLRPHIVSLIANRGLRRS